MAWCYKYVKVEIQHIHGREMFLRNFHHTRVAFDTARIETPFLIPTESFYRNKFFRLSLKMRCSRRSRHVRVQSVHLGQDRGFYAHG